jgi:hypothetical protein
MSEKIHAHHLSRKAMLYVRQSSAFQVAHNQESQKLQYAMQTRLRDLGWSEIEIVDEDLGRSAAGTATRSGFERMVAEVCLGRVGAVAAREVSRFARNSREWQQLVEVCRVRLAVERGELNAEHPLPDGPWIFSRNVLEAESSTALAARARARHRRTPAIPTQEQAVLDLSTT